MAAAAPASAPDHLSGAVDRVPHDLFIAGEWQPAAGAPMPVINPATEGVIAEVADADRGRRPTALRAAADAPGGLGGHACPHPLGDPLPRVPADGRTHRAAGAT